MSARTEQAESLMARFTNQGKTFDFPEGFTSLVEDATVNTVTLLAIAEVLERIADTQDRIANALELLSNID